MKKHITLLLIIILLGNNIIAQGWNYVTSTGTTFILFGMSFPPNQSNIGYACGMQYTYDADGVIVKTTDGGDNWTEILPTSGTIDGLQGIWFISDNVGFAGGWNNYFIKTTDGGTNWTNVTCGSNVWYYVDVEFWDANNGVAAASMNSSGDQAIFITSDGGNTWVPATSGADVNIMGISYADQNTLFAVGTAGNVFKSTDAGHNWTISANVGTMLFGLDFANATFGVVGGEEKMFATNDGGTTWSTYTTGYENFYAAKAYSDGTGYIGGTDENIYVTTDFGATWSMEHNGTGTSSLYRIKETQDGDLFACGSQGTIITKASPFMANFSASTDTVCEGNTVDFTDLSSGGITSWSWTFEGGTPATSTNQNPTITYNTTGDFDVTLEISDGANTNTMYIDDMIHVIVAPLAPSTPTGSTEICGGSTEEYTTTSVAGATQYFWEVDPADAGTITGTDIIGTFIADDSWTGDYTVKVKAVNVCGSSPFSNTLSCTLNFNPYSFQLSDGGGYCSGTDGVELTLDGSETGVDYELFLDDISTGTIIAGTGNPISFGYLPGQGIYTVLGTAGTCSEFMTGTPYIFVKFVPEQATTPDGPSAVCQESTTDYSTEPIFASDTIYWALTPVESGIFTGSDENISITWDADFTGQASLTAQGYNECGFGNESDPLEITVSASPSPNVTGLTLVCDEEETNYTTDENPGSTYSWTVTGGEIVSGSGTYQILVLWGYPGIGTVEVSETIADDCSGTSEQLEVTIDDCTGLEEITASEFTIYPNPAKDKLNINFSIELNDKYTITIQNLLGQITTTFTGVGTGENQLQSINISDMQEGQYIISIVSANGSYARENFIVVN
jgi:photosystem II stability/assembly factor-like uncharacterized protein